MKLQQFGSSLSLPDRVLTFIRDHPLMDRPVFPADGHPLLVTTDTAYLRIVAHRVTSLSGKEYDVLYLGTGTFHSQVSCPSSAHMPLSQRGSHTYRCQSPRHRYSCHCVLPLACFLEDGHLHRAVQIGAQLSVLEDLALFPEPQPIESMKLYQVSCRFWGVCWGDI